MNLSCVNAVCSMTFLHHDGEGDTWMDTAPTGTYNVTEAATACQTYVNARGGNDICVLMGCGCGGNDPCVYNMNQNPRHTWFYGPGAMKGYDTLNCCGCAHNLWD